MAGYCKWTQACTNPGPWLAWINGAFYECTEPDKADRDLYCTRHAKEFQRLKIRNSTNLITEDGEVRVFDERPNPLLLYCRRQLEMAVEDAKETDTVSGLPTDIAIEAKAWIEDVPDHKDKGDFMGTFEWCCHWLGLDIKKARKEALGEINASPGWQRGQKSLLMLQARGKVITRLQEERGSQLQMF